MNHKRYWIFSILLYISAFSVKAQDAVIRGTVSDSVGVVSFSNVFLKGTNIGTTTDENGKFTLENLPVGDHVLVASFNTYKTAQKNISLKSNSDITINFMLKPDPTQLDEVVIT